MNRADSGTIYLQFVKLKKCRKTISRNFFKILIFLSTFYNPLNFIGELYTWGKGRYGRLGHGDSEDQTRPKLVEALIGFRVIDIACGT